LWTDNKKLSKRSWDVSVELYIQKWYLVEALLNYVSLLWWNPKTTQEIFSMKELIKMFDLRNVHKAWAVFDIEKLKWFNAKYIVSLDDNELYNKLVKYLKNYDKTFYDDVFSKFDDDYNKKILRELKTRIKKFDEYKDLTHFFYGEAAVNIDIMLNEKMGIKDENDLAKSLQLAVEILDTDEFKYESVDDIKQIFLREIKNAWMKNGQLLWPVRAALSWEQFSPWALEMIYILWKEKSIKRLKKILINVKS